MDPWSRQVLRKSLLAFFSLGTDDLEGSRDMPPGYLYVNSGKGKSLQDWASVGREGWGRSGGWFLPPPLEIWPSTGEDGVAMRTHGQCGQLEWDGFEFTKETSLLPSVLSTCSKCFRQLGEICMLGRSVEGKQIWKLPSNSRTDT